MFEAVRTHQEVADILGCSKQNVQQIEKKALRKLAAILFEQGWDLEDVKEVTS